MDDKSFEMAELYRSGLTLQQIGDQYEISRQRVQQILSTIGITAADRPLKSALIDRERLDSLYTIERLTVQKIAKVFDVSPHQIYSALKFHKIPPRRSLKKDGKYVDIIRLLKIGESTEIQCAAVKAYVVLHRSAKYAETKISLRKLSEGLFSVTKVA